jgi:hypothetical protein
MPEDSSTGVCGSAALMHITESIKCQVKRHRGFVKDMSELRMIRIVQIGTKF